MIILCKTHTHLFVLHAQPWPLLLRLCSPHHCLLLSDKMLVAPHEPSSFVEFVWKMCIYKLHSVNSIMSPLTCVGERVWLETN